MADRVNPQITDAVTAEPVAGAAARATALRNLYLGKAQVLGIAATRSRSPRKAWRNR